MTIEQRNTAARILREKGQEVTLTRRTNGAYDPSTGTSTVTETSQTVNAVILPISRTQGAFMRLAGTSVELGDLQCILAAKDTSGNALNRPEVNDKITDSNGREYTVTSISPLEPAGTSILYTLIIRGS